MENYNNIAIGKRIKKRIVELGFNSKLLATKLNLNLETIELIEVGKYQLDLELITNLASILEVTNDYLLTGDFKGLVKNTINNKSSRDVTILKELVFYNKQDYILLLSLPIIFILSVFFKASDLNKYIFIGLMILSLMLIGYYFIKGKRYYKDNLIKVNIKNNQSLTYKSSIDDNTVKKYRQDLLKLNILIIVCLLIFYTLLVMTILPNNLVFSIICIVLMILVLVYKIYSTIISYKNITSYYLNKQVVTYIGELIINIIFILGLVNLESINIIQMTLFSSFILFINYIVVIVNAFLLSKYTYKIL